MSIKHQTEACELADLEVVTGGGYIPQRIGFGVRTDRMIELKQVMESNLPSLIERPILG